MDLDVLAARSAGLSGAEVAHVCREAGMQARDGWGGGGRRAWVGPTRGQAVELPLARVQSCRDALRARARLHCTSVGLRVPTRVAGAGSRGVAAA